MQLRKANYTYHFQHNVHKAPDHPAEFNPNQQPLELNQNPHNFQTIKFIRKP